MLFSIANFAKGQYYERVYGDSDDTKPVFFHVAADGGLAIAANANDTNNLSGYYLLKTDAAGNTTWNRQYNDAYNAYSRSITTFPNGNIFLLGSHESALYQSSAESVLLDTVGNILNAVSYPPLSGWGTSGVGVCNQSDSTVAILIYNNGVVSSNYFSVYSLNPDLSVNWNDFVGVDDANTTEHGISALQNGLYTISYYDLFLYSTPPLFNVTHVRKHDSAGALSLDSIFEFGCPTTGVTTSADGGALISGTIDTLNQSDVALFRIDSAGNLLWHKRYGSRLMEYCNSVTMTSDSGFAILATVEDSLLPGQHDLWLLKIDQFGDSLWSRSFGGTLDERGLHIESVNSDLVILGNTTSTGSDHIYILRTDSLGLIPASYTILANGRNFCAGDTAEFYLNPSPRPDMHIQWSNGDTINPLRTVLTGTYAAVITDTSGYTFRTPYSSVYFASPPSAVFGTDTMRLCSGSILRDTASNDITDIYQWYFNGSVLPGENLNYLEPTQRGFYSLTVKNYCSGDSTGSLVDTLFTLPAQPVIVSSHTGVVCLGDSVLLSCSLDTTYVYQWFYQSNIIAAATDTFYYANANGDYSLQVMNVNGCQIISFPHTITYDDFPEYVNANGPTTFCNGGEISLSASDGSGYLWSNSDTLQQINVSTTGNYYVNFTDLFGCNKNSDTIAINVLPRPTVNLGNDTLVCSGSTLTLDAGAGFGNYLWMNGSTTQTLLLQPSSPFPDTVNTIIFVVDSNSCQGSDTILVIFDICSGITGISMNNPDVFPNPIHHDEILKIRSEESFEFTLFDVAGRCVIRSKEHFIEISNVKSGIYSYRLLVPGKIKSGILVID